MVSVVCVCGVGHGNRKGPVRRREVKVEGEREERVIENMARK